MHAATVGVSDRPSASRIACYAGDAGGAARMHAADSAFSADWLQEGNAGRQGMAVERRSGSRVFYMLCVKTVGALRKGDRGWIPRGAGGAGRKDSVDRGHVVRCL